MSTGERLPERTMQAAIFNHTVEPDEVGPNVLAHLIVLRHEALIRPQQKVLLASANSQEVGIQGGRQYHALC
ncbi:hypothetical protein GCM10007890_01540 [Methylobacterium tardum]|uniref:Uncharacterized protein n=1 Tax=Methylobacterium tardum TaxID=374432 RepID=A0AA37WQQ4_9HYPH|nr:hypothetical protein GCM10007890_01540 [Methylobacterium tardum]